MTTAHRWVLPAIAALAVAGCAAPTTASGTPDPATPAATSRGPAAMATGTPATMAPPATVARFCAGLPDFKASVTKFRSELGRAVYGQPLDFGSLDATAGRIAGLGRRMLPDAPSDIAGPFRTALDAIATSAAATKPGGSVRDAVTPVFTDAANSAFEAVDEYGAPNCPDAGPPLLR